MLHSTVGHIPFKLALALGGGAARGWGHIGAMHALNEANIFPDIIAGTSIGAVVGGCYAANKLDELEEFARSLTRRRIFSLLDLRFDGAGLIGGMKVETLLKNHLGNKKIENLPVQLVTVAADLHSGQEVWFTKGDIVPAMVASYSLPGIFTPHYNRGRWLVDGALVNPIPVSVCRAYEADFVIAIQVDSDRPMICDASTHRIGATDRRHHNVFINGNERRSSLQEPVETKRKTPPGTLSTLFSSFNIIQERTGRARLASDPPDLHIRANIPEINYFDFHKADETIEHGYNSIKRFIPDILNQLEMLSGQKKSDIQALPPSAVKIA